MIFFDIVKGIRAHINPASIIASETPEPINLISNMRMNNVNTTQNEIMRKLSGESLSQKDPSVKRLSCGSENNEPSDLNEHQTDAHNNTNYQSNLLSNFLLPTIYFLVTFSDQSIDKKDTDHFHDQLPHPV